MLFLYLPHYLFICNGKKQTLPELLLKLPVFNLFAVIIQNIKYINNLVCPGANPGTKNIYSKIREQPCDLIKHTYPIMAIDLNYRIYFRRLVINFYFGIQPFLGSANCFS